MQQIRVSKFPLSFSTEGCVCYKRLALLEDIQVCDAPYITLPMFLTVSKRIEEDDGLCYQVDEGTGYVNLNRCDPHSRHEGKLKALRYFSSSFVNGISGKA